MRFQLAVLAAALAAALAPLPSQAATWQPVVAANGDRAEVDRDRILRTGPGRTVAWTRLVLGRELRDGEGTVYTSIQAMNRYDCQGRRFATLKRVYMQGERALREETVSSPKEMRAEPGSAEDKLLAEVCRLRPVAQADPATAEGGPGVMHADLRAATADTAARTVPVVDAKPATKVPEKSASPAAEKAVEGSAEKPARPRFIELPKIDKSQLEDPHKAPPPRGADGKPAEPAAVAAAPAPAKSQTAKAAEARVTEARSLAKSAQSAMEKPTVLSRQEIERQYATSGPRRTAPAVRKKVEPDQAVQEHKHIHWSYEGEGAPANWGKLRPDYGTCATGKRQSPIDIRDGIIKVDLEPIRFDYKHTLFRIVDNGHTVQVAVGEGSTIHVMGRSYELVQFHFHKPSEERINGRAFDMVVHLVHKDLDGNLAVIAVLLERGAEHPLIQTLWNHMPLEPDMAVEPPEAAIDLNGLLPENRNYYTYMGSLTTPPCTEGVLWMVMKQPMQVSPEQIAIFSRLYRHNARPVQPANNRLIKESR